jgi:hypothetical protein
LRDFWQLSAGGAAIEEVTAGSTGLTDAFVLA